MALKKSQKSLKKWTKQKWGYITKSDEKKPRSKRGRYLPKSVRKSLTKGQKAYENRKKRAASKAGKQRARYSKSTRRKMRNK
jgi:FtsZ-interacting cell division protein YlmF